MITVYPQEIKDGLSHLVKSNASIAYVAPVVKSEAKFSASIIDKTLQLASTKAYRSLDRIDLYPIQTILVTTGCNINLDIFSKEDVWAARFSAEDKPFNYMHKQQDIIGHITNNFVIDGAGDLVPLDASIEDVPDQFHIVTPAVIYRFWEDRAQKERIEKIIAEIERGDKWFVSMECLFTNFDYGVIAPDGKSHVIARNDETAGLTKFLRQYGGSGKIDGNYTIGRVLRNITFSGKGLVSNPANPQSIIFKNMKTFASVSQDLGYISLNCYITNNSKGKSIMADVKELSTATLNVNIEDNAAFKLVKAENESLKLSVSELTKKLSETSSQATTERIASLENEITSLKASLTETSDKLAKAEQAAKDFAAAKDEVVKDLEKMKKEKADAERVSALVALNASVEEANKVVAEFSDLSDEKFASVVALLSTKWSSSNAGDAEEAKKKTEEEYKKASSTKGEEKMMKDKDADKDGDCKAEKVVDTAKAEADANLGVSNIDNVESTRAAINDWFNTKVRGRATQKD